MWPTKEKPDVPYRFNSFFLEIDQRSMSIERQTYSVLELVGDVGGLYDGLSLILTFFIAPFGSVALNKKLLTLIFGNREKRNWIIPCSLSSKYRNRMRNRARKKVNE